MDAHALAQGRRAFWLTVAALAWAVALVVAAFMAPAYSTEVAAAPSGAPHAGPSETLVGVNGIHVLFVVGAPTVIAALVWIALHHRCSRGSRAGGYLAWTLIAIVIAVCVLEILSVGIFIAPVAALLGYAASITPRARA